MLLNVLDFASVQSALDFARPGDRVYFPGVKEYRAPVGGWRIRTSVEIFGDGPGNPNSAYGTVLTPGGSTEDVLVLEPPPSPPPPAPGSRLGSVFIHDLRITRNAIAAGRDGIRFVSSDFPGRKVTDFRMERVAISLLGGAGLRLEGGATGDTEHVVGVYLANCDFSQCGSVGVRLSYAFQTFLVGTRIAQNGLEGLYASDSSEVVLQGCSFDANRYAGGQAELVLESCLLASVVSSRFSNFSSAPARRACLLSNCGGSGIVDSCVFELAAVSALDTGIELSGSTIPGVVLVLANRFVRVGTAIRVNDLSRGCVIMPQYSDPGPAVIQLPSSDSDFNIALLAQNGPSGNALSGMLIPVITSVLPLPGPNTPGSTVQLGALAYQSGQLWAVTPAGWRAVSTQPYP